MQPTALDPDFICSGPREITLVQSPVQSSKIGVPRKIPSTPSRPNRLFLMRASTSHGLFCICRKRFDFRD
jgi:hypothetical protein